MKVLPVTIAALGGLVAGAALGLLLAPEKGEVTRTKVLDFLKKNCPCTKAAKLEALADEIAEDIKESV